MDAFRRIKYAFLGTETGKNAELHAYSMGDRGSADFSGVGVADMVEDTKELYGAVRDRLR